MGSSPSPPDLVDRSPSGAWNSVPAASTVGRVEVDGDGVALMGADAPARVIEPEASLVVVLDDLLEVVERQREAASCARREQR
jgi:hypothetical protein